MPTAAFKKSLYVFLCSLLGMLILLTLLHAIIFLYLSVITAFGTNDSLSIDLYSLNASVWFISVFLGGWWGVWLGLGWYKMVYEDAKHKGFVHGLATALYGFSQGGKKIVSTPVVTKPKWSLSDIIPKTPANSESTRRVVVKTKARPITRKSIPALVEKPKKTVKKVSKKKSPSVE